ncbi:MAG: ribonuclease Y [Candidatus Margulisbacteria bacterium]|nr:ribonuclease Y [Candidatus Margulisiibacteriota bacterium]
MSIITIAVVLVSLAVIVYVARKIMAQSKLNKAEKDIQRKIEDSSKKAKTILSKAENEANEWISNAKKNFSVEIQAKREDFNQLENRLMQKEKHLDERETHMSEKDVTLSQELERVKSVKQKHDDVLKKLLKILEEAANLSREEARKVLLDNVERECRQRAGTMIKEIESQAKKVANQKAKEIITDAIQRTAMDHVVPSTTSVVQLPDDDMKGRIIGREGRNIRSFEAQTGVDVIIDDTPGAVVLSAFDPIRREISKMALQALVEDGRIHPTRIEEMVNKCREELQGIIRQRGEEVVEKLGIELHPKIKELLGKLHYRTSYGQNMLTHAVETARIAANMAELLGVNINLAIRGGLLHDIGKAVDFEQKGSHTDLGEEICRRYGESEEVINCIMAHHEDEEPETIEAVIVTVADAISSVRPGARKESLDLYIKRLEKLENLAHSFEGIDKAYAIQAGREIRVIVKPDEIDDPSAHKLAFDIAQKIEAELDYPGEVRVSIIRETRAVATAR